MVRKIILCICTIIILTNISFAEQPIYYSYSKNEISNNAQEQMSEIKENKQESDEKILETIVLKKANDENVIVQQKHSSSSTTITNESNEDMLKPVRKLIPKGSYTSVDKNHYTKDELELLNVILAKVQNCDSHNLEEEYIDINKDYDYYSYYKIASYFYVYYGQKQAVDETFDLINYNDENGQTKTKQIRLRYNDIRQFEQELEKNKRKIDLILKTFTDGSEEHILKQISNYLKDNITYLNGYSGLSSALDGKGVCNGYALAFNAMANRAGITSNVCIGKVNDEYHAWNRVTLSDGEYRYYDITFYDTGGNTKYLNSKINFHNSYLVDNYADCWTKK